MHGKSAHRCRETVADRCEARYMRGIYDDAEVNVVASDS